MAITIRDLLNSNTSKQFEGMVSEVVQLVENGMIDQAITKIRSGGQIIRSAQLSKSFFESLPVMSRHALSNFFSTSATAAVSTPVLAYSSHYSSGSGRWFDSFCDMIYDISVIALKVGVFAVVGGVLWVFEAPAIAIGFVLFAMFVIWIAWEGQQTPRVAMNSNPTFMARMQREMVSLDRQVRSCGVLS